MKVGVHASACEADKLKLELQRRAELSLDNLKWSEQPRFRENDLPPRRALNNFLAFTVSDYIIHLIGGVDGETATLTTEDRDELCHISFRYRDQIIEASAADYFDAFCRIRLKLEPERLIPFCYGASLHVFPSSMSRSMGSGLKAYRLTTGRQALTKDLVSIFDSGRDVIPASVANQKEHYNNWIHSLKAK